MNNPLQSLFESQVLDEKTKYEIKEYFENKLKEAEIRVREEYAKRFELDKANLIEALDRFVNETLQNEISEIQEEKKILKNTREKLVQNNMKLREESQKKLYEKMKSYEKFITECLAEEVKEFINERKIYKDYKKKMQEKLAHETEKLREEMKNHLNKIDQFVTEELSKEISEFYEDKRTLANAKANFLKESREKLTETKNIFIKRAAKLLEENIDKLLRSEIKQFRNDINRIRENNFGRKIFEAFGQEFMNSYLAEGTKIKSAINRIKILEAQLNESRKQSEKMKALLESQNEKIRKTESLMERAQKLEKLLKPLTGDKRKLMESMLNGVPNENLEKAFSRYLPFVMGKDEKKPLLIEHSENKNTNHKLVVTGNKPENNKEKIVESRDDNVEIFQLRKLAGIA